MEATVQCGRVRMTYPPTAVSVLQDAPSDAYHDHWAYWASRDLVAFLLALAESA
jgi:hypothetical protein